MPGLKAWFIFAENQNVFIMRKFIMTAAVLFSLAATAQSEETKFGIKGGVQFTNYSGDGDWKGNTGFYVGGLADVPISGAFHIQPELLISKEGATGDTELNDVDFGTTYIRIPVMFKYYVAQGFNIQAGPQVAFRIATVEDAVEEATKGTDIGLGVGLGYDLANGLLFDLRYNLGLTSISEVEEADLMNTGIMLGIGYRF